MRYEEQTGHMIEWSRQLCTGCGLGFRCYGLSFGSGFGLGSECYGLVFGSGYGLG
jgi:hypothetical protein